MNLSGRGGPTRQRGDDGHFGDRPCRPGCREVGGHDREYQGKRHDEPGQRPNSDEVVCALFEARPIGKPDDQAQDEAEEGADEADDDAVRPHHEAYMTIGRPERFKHPDRAEPALCEHGEASNRHKGDEQHPQHQRREGDRLGVERIRLGNRGRRLHRRPDGARRHTVGVEECGHLRRRGHLPGSDEGELVEQALGVLHGPDDAARRAGLVPQVTDLQVEGRGDGAGDGDLIGSGRIVPGEQREHGLAEWATGALCPQLIRVDGTRYRVGLVLDDFNGAEAALEIGDLTGDVGGRAVERRGVLRGAEAEVGRLPRVDRDSGTDDGCRHRHHDERKDQQLLAPLPPEEAPCPADHGPPRREPAIGGNRLD